MTIKTMTIDEIEAWWEAHPEVLAYPSEANHCLIAVPLKAVNDGFSAISVGPNDDPGNEGGGIEVYVDDGTLGPVEVIPLDPTPNRLALEFDRNNQRDYDETASLTGLECLTFIRDFKKEKLGGTA